MTYAEIKQYIINTIKADKPLHGQAREWYIDMLIDGYIREEDFINE